jgi:uncharacterized membrane protein (DUF2068 family)
LALGVYSLIDNNLPSDFKHVLHWLHLDPESAFWASMTSKIEKITPKNILWVASGTLLYASISLAEAIGLIMRQRWAGWLAISEGAFFIPIEVFELRNHFSTGPGIVLGVNVIIVAYLWLNRERLFDHAGGGKPSAKPKAREKE